jgi:hypothetical protein
MQPEKVMVMRAVDAGVFDVCGTLETARIITPLISVNSPHKEG